MNINWHHVSNPPTIGGSYIVGGYVDGPPRHFDRAFGTCILLESGPSWSVSREGVPIEYWHELLPHPNHVPRGLMLHADDDAILAIAATVHSHVQPHLKHMIAFSTLRTTIADAIRDQVGRQMPAGQVAGEFLPLCEDEGCDHHGTPHVCINNDPKAAPEQKIANAAAQTFAGYCITCAAGPREYHECERPDCQWIET